MAWHPSKSHSSLKRLRKRLGFLRTSIIYGIRTSTPALSHQRSEPSIDAKTMEIHHGKHHATYVTNLNKALESAPELAKKPVDELIADLSAVPEAIRGPVRNNGGGHSNHTFFWKIMAADAGGAPTGKRPMPSKRSLAVSMISKPSSKPPALQDLAAAGRG